MATGLELTAQIEQRLLARNQVLESFFALEACRLAEACREMSERFLRGGRLAGVWARAVRDGRAARLGRIRASGHRRKTRAPRTRSFYRFCSRG